MKSKCNKPAMVALIGALMLSAGAMAAEHDELVMIRSVSVKFSATKVAEPGGAAVLYSRLKSAARRVCRELWSETLTLEAGIEMRECANKAVADAVGVINLPALTALRRHEPSPGVVGESLVARR